MTVTTMPLPGLEAIVPQARLRPVRFIVFERDADHDRCEDRPGHDRDACTPDVDPVLTFDDEDCARQHVERHNGDGWPSDELGVWDNWLGAWLVEPDWAEAYVISADGWTRLDLRVGAQ